jgi:hypothetical protein
MSIKSKIEATLKAIQTTVSRQKSGPTPAQARAIANCTRALESIARGEAASREYSNRRSVEITFIDRERLMIAADKAPTQAARAAARQLLDRSPPRMTSCEKRRFGL